MSERDGAARTISAPATCASSTLLLALLGGEREGAQRCLAARRRALPPVVPAPAARRLRLPAARGGVARGRRCRASCSPACAAPTSSSGRARSGCASACSSWRRCCARKASRFLVLKGLPFAERYYGAYDRRATGDLDVWVPRDRAPARRGAARAARPRARVAALRRRLADARPRPPGRARPRRHRRRAPSRAARPPHLPHRRGAVVGDARARSRSRATSYDMLSDEHALLLHLLGLHTDIQIGQTNARWFADLFRMLLRGRARRASMGRLLRGARRDRTRQDLRQQPGAVPGADPDRRALPGAAAALDRRRADIVLDARSAGLPGPVARRLDARAQAVAAAPVRGRDRRGGVVVGRRHAAPDRRQAGRLRAGRLGPARGQRAVGDHRARERRAPSSRTSSASTPRPSRRPSCGSAASASRCATRPLHISTRSRSSSGCARGRWASRRLRRPRSEGRPRPASSSSSDAEQLALLRVPSQPVVRRPLERLVEIHDGIVHLWVREPRPREGAAADRGRARASSPSTRAAETRPLLLHSLMVVLNKLLSLDRRYHLHAAAAAVGGRHLALRRRQGQRQVDHHVGAGQGGRDPLLRGSRDAPSRRRSLPGLGLRRQDAPHREAASATSSIARSKAAGSRARAWPRSRSTWPPSSTAGPTSRPRWRTSSSRRWGSASRSRPLAKEEAAARLLEPVLERHRFVDDAEQAAFLDVFARLVESCDTWEVDLSRDLAELDRLVEFLARARRRHARPARAARAVAVDDPG